MSIKGLVSVIVPSYNVKKYISHCLDTILAQTYKNLEVICVNDGSTDGTGDIIAEYSKKDSRISVITKENGGVSSARNLGIDASNGEFIVFIDSDDYISELFCERLVTLINEYDADIARCRGRGVESHDYIEPEMKKEPTVTTRTTIEALDVYYDGKFYGWYADDASSVCNCLCRRKIFDNVRFNEKLHRCEDESVILRAIGEAKKVVYTDERFYFYYNRHGSLTHSSKKDEEHLYAMKTVYADHQDYFKRKGYEDIRQKDLKAACDNFCEICISSKKREVKKDAFDMFKKYYSQMNIKPRNLKFFNLSPMLYSIIVKLKK